MAFYGQRLFWWQPEWLNKSLLSRPEETRVTRDIDSLTSCRDSKHTYTILKTYRFLGKLKPPTPDHFWFLPQHFWVWTGLTCIYFDRMRLPNHISWALFFIIRLRFISVLIFLTSNRVLVEIKNAQTSYWTNEVRQVPACLFTPGRVQGHKFRQY